MKKGEKEQVIAELKDDFNKAKAVIFTDYRGMTVAELSELRRLLRDRDIKYRVVKNTFARIASLGTPVSVARDSFKGSVGVVISCDDPVLTAGKVIEYLKKNEKLKINSGIIEGRFYVSDDIKAIAELPPRKVLMSMVVGSFRAPLGKFAAALSASINSFAYVMNALKTKRECQ
ncbi:MAG: 50S ribosomal protein L10 [Nitrospirota bacterium]